MTTYTNQQAKTILNNFIEECPNNDGEIIQGGYKQISKYTFDEYSKSDIGEITIWQYRSGANGSNKKFVYNEAKSLDFFALIIQLKNQLKQTESSLDGLLEKKFNPMKDLLCPTCGGDDETCYCGDDDVE